MYREKRLIARKNIEKTPEQAAESIEASVEQSTPEVSPEVKEMQEKRDVLAKVREDITEAEKSTLQKMVKQNLDPQNSLGSKETEKTAEKTSSSHWYDIFSWEKLSPETKRNVKAGAIAAGTVLGVVALYKVGKWLFSTAKKGVEKTKEGIGWLGKILLIGGALTLAGAATYFGFKRLEGYLGGYAKESLEKGIALAKKQYADLEEKLKTATAEERAMLTKKLEEISVQKEKMEERLQEVLSSKDQNVKKKEETSKTISEERREEKREKEEKEQPPPGSLDLVAFGLARYFENNKVASVIDALKEKKLTEIASCYDWSRGQVVLEKLNALYTPPTETGGDTEKEMYVEAARQLIEFCAESQRLNPTVRSEVTLGGYLRGLGGGYAMLHEALESIAKGAKGLDQWNPGISFISHAREGAFSLVEDVGGHIKDDAKRVETTLQQHDVTMQEVGRYLGSHEGELLAQVTVNKLLSENIPEEEKVRRCIQNICKEALPSGRELAPYFHEVLPGYSWNAKDTEKNYQVIEGYLREMPVGQALRFAMYHRMLRSGNTLQQTNGVALTQIEILRFIRQRDPGRLGGFIKPDLSNASLGLAEGVSSGSYLQALQEVNIPPEVAEQAATLFKRHAPRFLEEATSWALQPVKLGLEGIWGTVERHPYIAPGVAVVGTSVIVQGPVRTVTSPARLLLWHINRTDARRAASILKSSPRWYNILHGGPTRALYARFINSAASTAQRQIAGEELNKMVERASQMGDTLGKKYNNELSRLLRRGATDSAFGEFLKTIDDDVRHLSDTSSFKGPLQAFRDHVQTFRTLDDHREARAALRLYARPLRQQFFGWMMREQGVLTSSPDEARMLLRTLEGGDELVRYGPVRYLLKSGDPEHIARLLCEAHAAHGPAGAKRAANYLLALKTDVPAAMRTPEVITLIASGKHGNPAAIGRFMSVVRIEGEITAESCANAVKSMTRWQQAGRGVRALYFLGAGVEAGFLGWELYNATQEYQKEKQERDTLEKNLRGELERLGLKPKKNDPDTYTGCGVTVSIKTLSEINPVAFEASLTRAGIAASALGVTLLAPSMVLGPGGLVVGGIAIAAVYTADAYWSAVEQGRHREFLTKAPPWLLAILGTEQTVHRTAYETMQEFNGITKADILRGGLLDENMQKQRIELNQKVRENTLLATCYRAFAMHYPELLIEMPGAGDPVQLLDPKGEFLKPGGGFEKIVRPYVVLRLHAEQEGEGVAFATSASLDINERLGGFIDYMTANFPAVSEYELEDAIEEGMLLYLCDLREKRWRDSRMEINTRVKNEEERLARGVASKELSSEEAAENLSLYRSALEEGLDMEVRENESRTFVFNVHPSNLPESEDGLTVAERLIQERYQREDTQNFRLPWQEQGKTKDIRTFARENLRPQFKIYIEENLRDRSPKDGPFTFDQLENMSTAFEPEAARDEFIKNFFVAIEPIGRIDKAFSQDTRTDTELRKKYEERKDDITFALQFSRHEDYYRDYVREWRGESSSLIPQVHVNFLSLLQKWAEQGYPTLIDEEVFGRFQEEASKRLRSPEKQSLSSLMVGPSQRTSSEIPGYEKREDTVLLSLNGYKTYEVASQRSIEENMKEAGSVFEKKNPLKIFSPASQEPRIRVSNADMRQGLDRGYLDQGGKLHPFIELQDQKDLVALTPQELGIFFKAMNGRDALLPLVERGNSGDLRIDMTPVGFLPLREYLLQSRVFVMVEKKG